MRTITLIIILVVLAILALAGEAGGISRAIPAYIIFMMVPGAVLYLFTSRELDASDLLLHALISSPVLTTAAVVLMMLFGITPEHAIKSLILAISLLAIIVVISRRSPAVLPSLNLKQALILSAIVIFFSLVAGFLPLSHEWWRMRSDAWFHAAVVAQIESFGIPPEDPYFAGLQLQYMWLYHALIFTVSKAAAIEPFKVMPVLNLQALAGLIVATFLFSMRLKRPGKAFAYGISSVLVVILGLNALFWVFFPFKLVRVFTGEVQGMRELNNIFSLSPFDLGTVRKFLHIYFNQVFFLDKFIVSTAFSLGLVYLAGFWCAVTSYLSDKKSNALALVVVTTVGMLAFHPAVGFIMLAGLAGGLGIMLLKRKSIADYSFKHMRFLSAAAIAGVILMAPYLYSIMHLKEIENVVPLGLSFRKTAGIFISCFLAMVLSAFQVKRLLRERTCSGWFIIMAALSIAASCLIIILPGPNTYDKLPFFVFYPLAVIGGWTLVELAARWQQAVRRRVFTIIMFTLILAPVNIIAMLGYCNTASREKVNSLEKDVSEWVGTNTPRDAIFFDSSDRVFLLVTGPRRYYWGTLAYSKLWGYNQQEMRKRKHVRDGLYSAGGIDSETLRVLGKLEEDVYVISRDGDVSDLGWENELDLTAPSSGMEKFGRFPALFQKRFSSGRITVLQVDKAACIAAAEDNAASSHDADMNKWDFR